MQPWYKRVFLLILHPYPFFEAAIRKGTPIPALLTFGLCLSLTYMGWWMIGIGPFSFRGTFSKILLALLSYPFAVIIMFTICRIMVSESHLRSFFAVWGFSYLPTFFFFLINILTHGLAKTSWLIQILNNPLFLLALWTFFLLMFLWKILFLTITLRLAGNLNLRQIVPAFLILMLIVAIYWGITSSLGWLQVPFI